MPQYVPMDSTPGLNFWLLAIAAAILALLVAFAIMRWAAEMWREIRA